MSDQPKPTGEWTDLLTKVFEALGEASMQWNPRPSGVFDSTETERIGNELWEAINSALATEREKVAEAEHQRDKWEQVSQELEHDRDSWQESACSTVQLRGQLASEQEKVQTYEGALIKIANDPNCDRCQVAVDAVAKVAK